MHIPAVIKENRIANLLNLRVFDRSIVGGLPLKHQCVRKDQGTDDVDPRHDDLLLRSMHLQSGGGRIPNDIRLGTFANQKT